MAKLNITNEKVTVKELKELLANVPDDTKICVGDVGMTAYVDRVEIVLNDYDDGTFDIDINIKAENGICI